MTVVRGVKNRKEAAPQADRPVREDLLRALVLEAYALVRGEGRVADRVVAGLTRRERRLYASERRALASGVYELLRSETRLTFLLRAGLGSAWDKLSGPSRHALLYEALRVSSGSVPPAKALAEAGLSKALLPGLLACANPGAHMDAVTDPVQRLSLQAALPHWLAERLVHDLGAEGAQALARSINERAPLTLRANRLRTDREALAQRLAAEGVTARPTALAPDGLVVDGRTNLFRLASFKEGLFEIQDEGSQLLALLMDAHPGQLVVDACAGAGGKTLALGAAMESRGRIVALDVEARRLDELKARARRAGVQNYEAHVVPADGLGKVARKLEGKADAVLIDAPCSGLGVLRRNPDARFRLDAETVERFSTLQRELLVRYARLAKPGGRIVYATCSVLRAEDEDVVERVLAEEPWLERVPLSEVAPHLAAKASAGPYLRTLPHLHGTDGFFGAVLRRRS